MKCVVCEKPVGQFYAIYLADGEFRVHIECFYNGANIPEGSNINYPDPEVDAKRLKAIEERAIELIKLGRAKN